MAGWLAAVVQMNSGVDKSANLKAAREQVVEAAERGAKFVALPELFNCLGAPESIVAQAEDIPGQTSQAMSALAGELRITLLAGSIAERTPREDKVYNTSLLFGPNGEQLARYRKIHLFDIDLPGRVTFQESDIVAPGEELVVTSTSVGTLGQATCYDLRFPELFRRLVDAGADFFAVPSAFTAPTGRDHWEVLLRARAIENQVFVIAPNQHGRHPGNLNTYGRSMIIDPWGTILATAADGPGVITAEIDFDRQKELRSRLPALDHRRDLGSMKV